MKKDLIIKILIVIASAVLLVLTLRGLSGNPDAPEFKDNLDQATKPFELSPERGRYAHIYNIAEYGHYDLTKDWAEVVYPDVGYRDGKFYGYFAPGISYMAAPFYSLGARFDMAQLFTFGFIALCAILSMLFLYQICLEIFKLPRSISIFVPLVFGFGTTALSYAITLYQHHVFTLLLLSAFYAVWKYKQGMRYSWMWGFLVWVNYALAIAIDYPNALLMLPVMFYFLIAAVNTHRVEEKLILGLKKSFIGTFVVFALVMGLHFYHNSTNFGSWKNLSSTLIGYKDIKEAEILDLNTTKSEEEISLLQADKKLEDFFSEQAIPHGFFTLLFSVDRGLFFFAPIMILGLIGLFLIINRANLEHSILIGTVVINVLLYSSWGDPWGGWAFGPRYLIPSMAILAIYVGIFLVNIKHRLLGRIIAFLLFVYSAAIALLGAVTTNAVPPKMEGLELPIRTYSILYNWEFMKVSKSGSYVYNTYFSQMSLMQYSVSILVFLALLAAIILFVTYRPEREPEHND